MSTTVGLLLSAAAAVCFTVGYVEQHRVVASGSGLSWRAPLRSTVTLVRDGRWLAANVVNIVGWGLFIGALRMAPLSIVQAVMAGSVGTLALVDARARGNPRVRVGAVVAACGLVLVAISSATHAVRDHISTVGIATFGLVALGGLIVALASPTRRRGVALGVASGIAYGTGDVLMKVTLLGRPIWLPAALAATAIGFVLLQFAYGHGSLFSTAGSSALITNALPIVIAVTLLGERLPGGSSSWIRAIGFVAVIVGAVVAAPTNWSDDRRSIDHSRGRPSPRGAVTLDGDRRDVPVDRQATT